MKANVGGIDRIIRIVAGVALIVWVLFANGPVWAWLGVIPLVTALVNFCPIYNLLGISSCRKQP